MKVDKLYDALIEAGASPEKARQACEEVAEHLSRSVRGRLFVGLGNVDLSMIWMLGWAAALAVTSVVLLVKYFICP